jgi:WD40 repeat protein/TPR repeat protein
VTRRLRIFLSSPGDVTATREIAALTIERLAQDYARFFRIEPYLWEYEAMVASGHFQDSIEPPSAFDIVVLIVWSRLGTPLPERTKVREYRGMDGRAPVTGTEWEYEEALKAAREVGTPDLLVYRSREDARVRTLDSERRRKDIEQLEELDRFWSRHFANQGTYLGAYTEFTSGAEFAAAFEKHLRKLIEKRIAPVVSASHEPGTRIWTQAPFRGLEAYEFEHAPIFFGQDDALTKAMVQLVASAAAGSPFLLVLGASGSGKSSLVKAGIVPKLFVPRRIPGVAFLRRVVFRPSDAQEGEDLFDALARRLTMQVSADEGLSELIGPGQSVSGLAAHLRNATAEPAYPVATALGQLAVAARQDGRMLEHETAGLVLVLDQLEELFTNELLTPIERQRFIALIAGLVRSGRVWVIATMRKDFWHQADDTPELVHMAEGHGRLELLPPTRTQLGQMIRRPAAAAGVDFEHHPTTDVPLNEIIAEEVAHDAGALPLVSYLLDQLYRRDVLDAQGAALTFATYQRLGRLEGAIATRAEEVLERCAPDDRHALGSVLFALIQMGTTDGDAERAISRRVALSTFPPGTAQRRLVEALLHSEARLLVSDAEAGEAPTVRVAHEALITRWARARDFVQDNAEALKIRRRIEERFALWRGLNGTGPDAAGKIGRDVNLRARFAAWRARAGREPGLLSEIDLIDGQRLLREHRRDTEPDLVDYIERSQTADKRIRSRSVRVLALVAGAVTILALLASGAGLIALQKQHEAEAQAQLALAAQLRLLTDAAARHLEDGNASAAQGIIVEVLTNRDSPAARSATAINVFQEVRAADTRLAVLSGHDGFLISAAFSPDGRHIVTSSGDRTARIWDAATATQLALLSGHGGGVVTAAFSPDGRRIVTASVDHTARIWDATTGKPFAVLSGHGDHVYMAAFSPDGRRIVTASLDGTARIWDAATAQLLVVLSGHDGGVEAARFSPDGRRIVTASNDKTARIWDAATGRQIAVLAGHGDGLSSSAFSPDGRRIVTASGDRTARIWDAATGDSIAVLSGHGDMVLSAEFSSDGRRIVTSSEDKTARIWDTDTAKPLAVLSGHREPVRMAAFSPDGGRIVTASLDGFALIWGADSGMQLAVLSDLGDAVFDAAYSPDGQRIAIASASGDRFASIWDAATVKQIYGLSGHESFVRSVVFSPDGRRIVTASNDRTARIWDAASGAQLAVLSGHGEGIPLDEEGGNVRSAAYSPDGRRIVTASNDKSARIWEADTGKQFAVLSGHDQAVRTAAFSPDGRRIVTASADQTARIWDAATARPLDVLSGHADKVWSAAFSPEGRYIVTASFDQTVRVWAADTAKQLAVLSGHAADVWSAAWSPDGRRIVTASFDRTARIWDTAGGVQLAVLSGHGDGVWSAAWSPDGRRIVTTSADQTVRIWDANVVADLDAQIAWSQAAIIDDLSDLERSRLGLPPDARTRTWPDDASGCDKAAAAPHDPDRRAPGFVQATISPELASNACAQESAESGTAPRLAYQLGRALLAKHDVEGAKRELERAVSGGYRAAQVDLAGLLVGASAGPSDYVRAVSLYEKAWREGVPIAAFELGRLYERGVPGAAETVPVARQPDLAKAWSWYRKGAEIGEPNALARLGERDDASAVIESSPQKRDALLLKAFASYAAAAERAQVEDWPDDTWKHWRYRRATLARLLAREGMMQQVADAYLAVRDKGRQGPPTWLEEPGDSN